MRLAVVLASLLVAAGGAHAAPPAGKAAPPPPPTPRHTASSVIHGVRVQDPYRWLEDADAPAVQDWIKAQNAYTEKVLATMPQGQAITDRVRQLAITSVTRSSPLIAGGTLFYMQETPPQPQPVLMVQAWPKGKARPLVDVNTIGGGIAITGYWPSPSGRYLAYGTAEGGSELTTLHVLEVATGKALGDALPWAGGGTTPQGVAWDADEKGFVYVRFPPPTGGDAVKQFDAELVHHMLGQSPAKDAVVFGKGYSHVAEYRLLDSPGAQQLAMLANIGDGGAAEVYLREGAQWKKVLDRSANVRGAAWVGQQLYVESFADAPQGRVLAVGIDGDVHPVAGAETKGALQGIDPIADGFLVTRSWGPDWWVEQYDAAGKLVRRLPLPTQGVAVGGIASEQGQTHALISYGGWTVPARWADYDASTGTLKTVFEVKPAADYSKVEVHQVEGTSTDGTPIPVTVLALRGITPNGHRPTILYGYGGFDIPIRPGFIGSNLAWLERGGVFAYANTRGGNEDGQAWHAQGQKLNKQNVFDDFHAAAMALEKGGWTDAAHLGIMGGSNGGLLMGAELTQHPADFRAVVSMVGIYDMLRHETDFANGAYNVSEYGSIADPAQFKATLAYSPLQNVHPAAYPAVLMTTGANDPRVAPWQSRKFTAALQRATTSGCPVLLLTRMNAGHGIGAPFAQRVGNTALALTFFAHELGAEKANGKVKP